MDEVDFAKAASIGCAMVLALTVPFAANAAISPHLPTTDQALAALAAGADPKLLPAEASTRHTGYLTEPPFDVPADALVINTPGTDDTSLYTRIDPMRGDLRTFNAIYPEALFPIVSGKSGRLLPIFAPTYDQSTDVAITHILETAAALRDASDKPDVVYTGYSQGADALGDAAEQLYAAGTLDPATDQIVLMSDPRSPWGVMRFAADNVLVGSVFRLVGASPDGARDPAATGDLPVTSVIVVGDPTANFQWNPLRPVSSVLVNVAGFLAIHAVQGPQSYKNLGEIGDVETLYSRDGRTTYLIYHVDHPLTQLTEMTMGLVGVHLDDRQVDQLEKWNDSFYPLQEPSPQNAAPAVKVTATPPARVTATTPVVVQRPVDEMAMAARVPESRKGRASAAVVDDGPARRAVAETDTAPADPVRDVRSEESADTAPASDGPEMTPQVAQRDASEVRHHTEDSSREDDPRHHRDSDARHRPRESSHDDHAAA